MADRTPNEQLARLFHETGWSQRQFAQEVNKLGTERGTPVRYSAQTAHAWLQGHIPREPIRPLVLEALSRRLRRPITHAQAGFPPPPAESASGTVDGLLDLSRQDMDPSRRSVIGAGAKLFSVALAIPGWQDVVGRMEAVQAGRTQRIGMPEVESVTFMTKRLMDTDNEFGGRYTSPMSAAFLANIVTPYLRADAPSKVRKEMLSAAAWLCYIMGWMTVDEGSHGTAQRYYIKGLELAGASGDYSTYCHILRGMSVQSADLEHGPTAMRLADAARSGAPTSGPRMRAFMAGQQAHSYALVGERTKALQFLQEAESALDKAHSPGGTFGGYNPATLAYHTAQVRHALGDVRGSVESLELHFRLRVPTIEVRRTKLRHGALLAERQLAIGHLDAACVTWREVIDEYPLMHSDKVDSRISEMFRLIRPHRKNPAARDLYERARLVAPSLAA